MFDAFPDGKIDAGSDRFSELQRIAEARLLEIERVPGTGLGAKLRRYISLSKLNALLSFYGWAICRDGTMIEVKVRGEPVNLCLDDGQKPLQGSIEELNDQALNCFIETGKVIDPRTGRQIPRSEGHRFGIT